MTKVHRRLARRWFNRARSVWRIAYREVVRWTLVALIIGVIVIPIYIPVALLAVFFQWLGELAHVGIKRMHPFKDRLHEWADWYRAV